MILLLSPLSCFSSFLMGINCFLHPSPIVMDNCPEAFRITSLSGLPCQHMAFNPIICKCMQTFIVVINKEGLRFSSINNIQYCVIATLTDKRISPLPPPPPAPHIILPAAILREEASGCRSEGERERGVGISPNMKIAANLPQLCHMRRKERRMWTAARRGVVVHTTKLCEISKL